MNSNEFSRIVNKVRQTSSTKSEQPRIRSHEYQPSLGNRYTILSRTDTERALMIAPFDLRRHWRESVEAQVKDASKEINQLHSLLMATQQPIRIIRAEINQIQSKLNQSKRQEYIIARRLRDEKNVVQIGDLELAASINKQNMQKIYKEMQEAQKQLDPLIQERDRWQRMITDLRKLRQDKKELLLKEKFFTPSGIGAEYK